MGKLVIGILAIFLLLGAFSTPILDGIKDGAQTIPRNLSV